MKKVSYPNNEIQNTKAKSIGNSIPPYIDLKTREGKAAIHERATSGVLGLEGHSHNCSGFWWLGARVFRWRIRYFPTAIKKS